MKRIFFMIPAYVLMTACAYKQPADLIIHNAVIYTVDTSFAVRQALAVKDGKILETGSDQYILGKYSATETSDAEGHALYPGFIDAHCHFLHYGLDLNEIDLSGTSSFEEVVDKVRSYAAGRKTGWITGRGWDQNDWEEKQFPDKYVLDSLFPDRPVFLRRVDGHAALANARALQLAGITPTTPIRGGLIEVRNGRLTGILLDNAADLVSRVIPEPGGETKELALLAAQKQCVAVGLTTVDDAGLSYAEVQLIDRLQQSGKLKIRVYAMLDPSKENLDHYLQSGIYISGRLSVRSFKCYADGALGSRGACLLKPYADVSTRKHCGFLLNTPEYLSSMAHKINRAGFQMCTHCIGDSANRLMLNIYSDIPDIEQKRWRIEHCQVLSPDDIDRFGRNGIIPSVQPTHATSDMSWAKERLGPQRISTAYAYARLLIQNGILPLGTDFPVEGIEPVKTFYAAVFRKNTDGKPEEGFQTENALSREEALKGMTIYAAYANFEERKKGSLEEGKLADFVLLDHDLLRANEQEILQTEVLATYIGGEKVYARAK